MIILILFSFIQIKIILIRQVYHRVTNPVFRVESTLMNHGIYQKTLSTSSDGPKLCQSVTHTCT